MKKLTHYKKNGYEFTIIKRNEKWAIAEGKQANCANTYELIEVQSHEGREIHGNYCQATEYPPCNNQWGVKGWTYKTLEGAISKMMVMIKRDLLKI